MATPMDRLVEGKENASDGRSEKEGGVPEKVKVSHCLYLKTLPEESVDAVALLQRFRYQHLCENARRFFGVASQGADRFMDCFSSP